MLLTDKTVLLTGASGGIGKVIAQTLAHKGARLILVGRDESRLLDIGYTLAKRNSASHRVIAVDITDEGDRKKLLAFCEQVPGGIDVLINNAGLNEFGFFSDMDPQKIERMIMTNLLAPIYLCHMLLPLLRQSDRGQILNMGSTFGSIGYPGFVGYSASKFALRGFSEALRREFADSPLEVHYLAPRATRTDINSDAICSMNKELGIAMDDPQVVAESVLKLLSGKGRGDAYIGWPEKLFVKINSLLPKIVDGSLLKQLPVIRRYADCELP